MGDDDLKDLTTRQRILLAYVAEIFSNGPSKARSFAQFLASLETSVLDCFYRDLPTVGKKLAVRGAPLLKSALVAFSKQAIVREMGEVAGTVAGPAIEGAIESLFQGLGAAIAPKKR